MADLTKSATRLRRRLTADAVAGAITLVLGVCLAIVAYGIEPSAFGNAVLQPRDLPLLCGIGLALSGAALLVQGMRQARHVPEVPGEDTGGAAERQTADEFDEDAPAQTESKRNLLALAVLLLGYLMTFIPLGYIAATALFLFIGSTFFSPGKLRRSIIFALVLSVGVYFLFTSVLGIVLPKGILEFIL